jgi:ATP-dependent 26S proteasome regulatory subunit
MSLENVELADIALKCNQFTGADLKSLCREASLIALRNNKAAVAVVIARLIIDRRKLRGRTC